MNFSFGPFTLDTSARELRRNGDRVETEPKAFELLAYLAEHRDRAVSKDELLNELWPRQIVTETALTRCVMKARRAVDDDAGTQSVIRTLHGHGYRFVATLDEAAPSPPTPEHTAAEPATDAAAGRRRYGKRSGVAAAFAALVAIVAVGTWFAWQVAPSPGSGAIAVLPVVDRTGDSELAWTRVGMMSLLARMLEEHGLDVVPDRQVIDAVAGQTIDSPPDHPQFERLRRVAGAATVLHTTLEYQGGLHRLVAVLTHADGRHSRRIIVGESPATLASDLAGVIAGLLHGRALPEDDRFSKVSTDPFVNELYARALDLELQGKLLEARDMFRLASAQEPELFWLRYEIALCTRDLREWDAAEMQFAELLEEAGSGADARALIVTLNSRGVMHLLEDDYAAAEADFRDAFSVATERGRPQDRATVLTNLGLISTRLGRLDEAAGHYEEALAELAAAGQAPSGFLLNNYAGLLLESGNLGAARQRAEQALETFRLYGQRRFEAPVLNRLARILRQQGDTEAALARHEESLAIYRDLGNVVGELSVLSALTSVYRANGDLTRARQNAADVLARSREQDDGLLLGDALMQAGYVEGDFGEHAAATAYFREADELFSRLRDAAGMHGARTAIAEMSMQSGDYATASALARELLLAAVADGNGSAEANARWLAGRIAEARGENGTAAEAYDIAIAYGRSAGDETVLAAAGTSLARLLLAEGRTADAARLVDEIRPFAAGSRDFLRLDARLALAEGRGDAARDIVATLRQRAGEAWSEDDDALQIAAGR